MVLKKLLRIFASFIGSVIDSSFSESVFGRDVADLVI